MNKVELRGTLFAWTLFEETAREQISANPEKFQQNDLVENTKYI